jgi:hypothetical protein
MPHCTNAQCCPFATKGCKSGILAFGRIARIIWIAHRHVNGWLGASMPPLPTSGVSSLDLGPFFLGGPFSSRCTPRAQAQALAPKTQYAGPALHLLTAYFLRLRRYHDPFSALYQLTLQCISALLPPLAQSRHALTSISNPAFAAIRCPWLVPHDERKVQSIGCTYHIREERFIS